MELSTVIWISLGIITIISIVAIMFMLSFKHSIRIKQVYDSKNMVFDDKFKIVRKKEGVYWKLLKRRELIPPAPDSVIEVGKRGRMVVTAYEIEQGSYVWQKDGNELLDMTAAEKKVFVSKTQPFTTTQRLIYMAQLEKAEREKKKTTAELITAAVPFMAIAMILTVFMIFFGDVIEPIQESANTAAAVSTDFKDAAFAIREACNPTVTPQIVNTPVNPAEVPN